MTIRDMLSAGIEIEGIIRVACWQNDECEVCFEDQAEHIGDQEFLDREITFMFANDGKLVFDILPAEENSCSVPMTHETVEDQLARIKAEFDRIVRENNNDIDKVYCALGVMLMPNGKLYDKDVLWCNGELLLAANVEIANIVADWFDELFDCACTGYYDPEYDAVWGLTDECTGYWYVDI